MSGDHGRLLGEIYNCFEGSESMLAYGERHGITSQAVLTVTSDETAHDMMEYLAPRIKGKTVVEIGGGIGLLAMHLGQIARRVYCIEANPMWSWIFAAQLIKTKPKNVSFLLGAADEFVGCIKADVALFCTHSGVETMRLVAGQFAPVVIDVYGEMIAKSPELFDPFARVARNFA